MSKVLIFSHKNDIDGMGSVVLSKLAFRDVDYVLCETFELQQQMAKFFDSGKIYEYDKVFVADLWLEEPMFSKVAADERLTDKFHIFDHHKSSFDHNHVASFGITLKVSDEKGLCCATSLFYEYLIKNGFKLSTAICADFVELTRQHDTWEWRTKYNNERARDLSLFFDAIDPYTYIETMYDKLYLDVGDALVSYNRFEEMLIENRKKLVYEKVKEYSEKLFYREIMGFKAGIAFIDYGYRNELGEYLREEKFDIDFLMIVAIDRGTVSYRSIKDGVNVREVAVAFGGKGHDKAATNPITKAKLPEIIDIIIRV